VNVFPVLAQVVLRRNSGKVAATLSHADKIATPVFGNKPLARDPAPHPRIEHKQRPVEPNHRAAATPNGL